MFRLSVPRNLRREATPLLKLCRRRGQQRLSHDRSEPHGQQRTQSRVESVNSKLPQFLRGYTKPLISAPLTHISAFLILHEVTAVVPILGFAAIFHYTNWLPAYISEWKWVSEGIQKFGSYARKKGWLGNEETRNFRWWEKGEGGLKVVVEFATAYAITKATFTPRNEHLALNLFYDHSTYQHSRQYNDEVSTQQRVLALASAMHHYERENAKEWQRDFRSDSKQKLAVNSSSDEEPDGEGPWLQVQTSQRLPKITIDPSSPKPSHQNSDTSPEKGFKKPFYLLARPTDERKVTQAKKKGRLAAGITFTQKQDNVARSAFRKGLPHTDVYTLAQTCAKIEPDRKKMYSQLEEIGTRFGSFIRPPQSLLDRKLLLWGDENQIRKTKAELDSWTQAAPKEVFGPREQTLLKAKVNRFSKVGDLQDKKDKNDDMKLREEAEKQKYQTDPPEGQDFSFRGYFLWPQDEVAPSQLLGPSCEAYDSIRTFNSAHIVFDTQMSCFKVLSNNEDAIQHVLQRIEGTMREYVARSGEIYFMVLGRLPEASKMRGDIKLVPCYSSSRASFTSTPQLTGNTLTANDVPRFAEEKAATDLRNKKQIRHALNKVITRLPFFRGNVRLRVLFGVFTFAKCRWPKRVSSVPVSKFLSDLRLDLPAFDGSLTRDLQFTAGADQIFAHCPPKNGLFETMNTMYGAPADADPVYTGRFGFSSPEFGEFSLEIELSKYLGGVYEISRAKWTKKGTTEASSPLDINMIQFNGGCSWKLQVSHEVEVDDSRVTPRMADFKSSVTYKPPSAGVQPELTGYKVFQHASNLKVEHFEQKTALRYRHVRHSNWIFELARYDSFTGNNVTASEKTQWGGSFWHTEWDNILGANNLLDIGEAANWDPRLSKFFPENAGTPNKGKDTGFQDFLQDVEYITEMLDGMKNLGK
ncbi:MAG: hypothetical protein Q9191_000672 [Dirinaria sp. TL-2023a]